MENSLCPNYETCRLVKTESVGGEPERRRFYIDTYCTRGEEAWSACKRFTAKKTLDFCPDFVLPDSSLTPSQIIDEFDRRS
jgi:hypothetical protein